MMKYSAAILLFAAAVFWSSASARPRYNPVHDDVIDVITRWAIEEMKDLPEPYKTRLTNKLHEAQHQHWDNIGDYILHVESTLIKFVRESGIDYSRRKRQIDSGSDESLEIDVDDLNSKPFYRIYARALIAAAPAADQPTLEKKFEKAVEGDFESFDDFTEKADEIFEEVTGLDLEKIDAEYDADAEKLSELKSKVHSYVLNHISEIFTE